MAKPEQRKARKDYPQNGIKVGDLYWFVKLKLQRGGLTLRSLKPFKPSQLTTSEFKSAWLGAQEDWESSDKDPEAIRSAAEAIASAGTEAQERFDNMPEGLQQGDTGQMLENRASTAESVASDLEGLADELEGLEEPVEPLGDLDDDLENESAQELYDSELSDFESEKERIADEVDALIGDMPE